MRLSEALRAGAAAFNYRQARGMFYSKDTDGVESVCVLGALYYSVTGEIPSVSNDDDVDELFYTIATACGVYGNPLVQYPGSEQSFPLSACLITMNDEGWMSFAAIIAYLISYGL